MSKQFELPKNWYIERTAENAAIINEWATSLNEEHEYILKSGYIYSKDLIQYRSVPRYSAYIEPGFTEITFDQFKQYVLMEKNKKIIGYKVPYGRLQSYCKR